MGQARRSRWWPRKTVPRLCPGLTKVVKYLLLAPSLCLRRDPIPQGRLLSPSRFHRASASRDSALLPTPSPLPHLPVLTPLQGQESQLAPLGAEGTEGAVRDSLIQLQGTSRGHPTGSPLLVLSTCLLGGISRGHFCGTVGCLLSFLSPRVFEIRDVISNCLFNIKVRKRTSASYKRERRHAWGIS